MSRRASGSMLTFDIKNSRDMVEKLRWELEQLRQQTSDREALVHHALNGAWTAWHVHDWVWAAIARDPIKRAKIAKMASIVPQKFDQDAFALWLQTDKKELNYCRIIATSAKHVGVEVGLVRMETRVSVVTDRVATIDDVPDFDALTDFDDLSTTKWVAKLTIDNKVIRSDDFLELVLGYWTQFIWSNDIDTD